MGVLRPVGIGYQLGKVMLNVSDIDTFLGYLFSSVPILCTKSAVHGKVRLKKSKR